MYRYLLIAAALGLSACATPKERCISAATEDISAIDNAIIDAQTNIARGYRTQDRAISTVGVNFCSKSGPVSLCLGGDKDIEPRKVPIDVAAERSRLAALQNQRAATVARMERQIDACRSLS